MVLKYESPHCVPFASVKEQEKVILFLNYHEELGYWYVSLNGGALKSEALQQVEEAMKNDSDNENELE